MFRAFIEFFVNYKCRFWIANKSGRLLMPPPPSPSRLSQQNPLANTCPRRSCSFIVDASQGNIENRDYVGSALHMRTLRKTKLYRTHIGFDLSLLFYILGSMVKNQSEASIWILWISLFPLLLCIQCSAVYNSQRIPFVRATVDSIVVFSLIFFFLISSSQAVDPLMHLRKMELPTERKTKENHWFFFILMFETHNHPLQCASIFGRLLCMWNKNFQTVYYS